uniref:Endonuclease/exonuclease/phosphatase domain-containing protein n=1 Tax=Fagus sylvatica TaxID=28930 RepID=A0A2N9G6G4_FAGSY
MVWRPRVNGSNPFQKLAEDDTGQTTANQDDDRVSLHSCDSDSQLSTIPAQPSTSQPIAEVIAEVGEVDRSWGSSRDWFINLRDGRRLRLPADLRSPIADIGRNDDAITQKLVQWVSSQRDAIETDEDVGVSEADIVGSNDGSKSVGVLSEYEAAEMIEGNEKNMPMVLTEETECSESAMLAAVSEAWGEFLESAEVIDGVGDARQKELVPLNVEPLAVSFPADVENHGSKDDGSFLRSSGASRGILLMWDSRVVEKLEGAVGYFSVSCKFKNVEDQHVWMFTGVYGPNNVRDRRLMWDELTGIRSWWDVPWCFGGDFNVVRFPSEKVGSSNFSPSMYDFSDFIASNGLIDIPLTGGDFTWSNNREVSSLSQIDRFLYSADWVGDYINILQKRLDRLNSDHFPVALECGNIQRRRRPFRFENMWLMAEGFVEQVRSWWESYQVEGTSSFVFASKLKTLKADLKKWNETVFGHVNAQKQNLLAGLRELDGVADLRPLSNEEKGKRELLTTNLEKVILMDEICWRQKSRALWLKEGGKKN